MGQSFIWAVGIIISLFFLAVGWKIIVIFSMSIWQIIRYLASVLWWRFTPAKYTGRYCLYKKTRRKIIGETHKNVKLKGKKGPEKGNSKIGYDLVPKKDIFIIN